MKLLFTSILSIDHSELSKELKNLEIAKTDCIHVDIMDGSFVPNITMGFSVVKSILKSVTLPVDIHLMISNPDRVIKDFVSVGANYISVHQESCNHLDKTIVYIKDNGIKAGVALNPETPLESIKRVIKKLDFILIMGVNPGFGGQKFIKNTVNKVYNLKKIIKEMNLNTKIQVDGGININNIRLLSKGGADFLVVGSAITNSSNYFLSIKNLKRKIIF